MPQFLLTILNMFSGPIGGLVDKGILAAVVWFFAKTGLQGDVAGIAASIYAAFSALFTAVTNTQTSKIQSVNTTKNGVVVVPTATVSNAGVATVATAPSPGPGVAAPVATVSIDQHGSAVL